MAGDPDDVQSRYIEAAVNGVLIACLYLPNGNPRPGPKFDFKLRWFERLQRHLATLVTLDAPVVVAGDFNVMPTELDVCAPERWRDDALFAPEVRQGYQELLDQGWLDALRHLHPDERIYTFWKYLRFAFERNAGLRFDHLLLNAKARDMLTAADVDAAPRGWEKPAIMRLSGSNSGHEGGDREKRNCGGNERCFVRWLMCADKVALPLYLLSQWDFRTEMLVRWFHRASNDRVRG